MTEKEGVASQGHRDSGWLNLFNIRTEKESRNTRRAKEKENGQRKPQQLGQQVVQVVEDWSRTISGPTASLRESFCLQDTY